VSDLMEQDCVADSDVHRERRRRAVVLLWLTVAWNVVEGGVAVALGVPAGSVALVGFGLDSVIEIGAASVLLWRLGVPAAGGEARRAELAAQRVVGATFIALAVYILVQSAYAAVPGNEPATSAYGLGLSVLSVAVNPALGVAKRRNAQRLDSAALVAESTETLICAYLAVTLLAGLAANAAFGWWWADVAAALAMVPWIAREGVEGLRGE
jgi:divalent metal cation (Fe/Co/Zn/Cd) transporter